MKNQPSPLPCAMFTIRQTKTGIANIAATIEPARALFLLKKRDWDSMTSSRAFTISLSMVILLSFSRVFLQSGHSARCSSTARLLAGLQTPSMYRGRRSAIISHLYCISIHPFYDLQSGAMIRYPGPGFCLSEDRTDLSE